MSDKGLILPVADPDSKSFWEGCHRHELLVQKCGECGTFRYPPRSGCHECGSLKSEWVKIKGKGEVFSYTIVPFASHPALEDKVPYNIAIVSLPEAGGVHMVSNLVDCANQNIRIGMPVEVVFEKIQEEITLPLFRPVHE